MDQDGDPYHYHMLIYSTLCGFQIITKITPKCGNTLTCLSVIFELAQWLFISGTSIFVISVFMVKCQTGWCIGKQRRPNIRPNGVACTDILNRGIFTADPLTGPILTHNLSFQSLEKNYVVTTVVANGLTQLGTRTAAVIMVTKDGHGTQRARYSDDIDHLPSLRNIHSEPVVCIEQQTSTDTPISLSCCQYVPAASTTYISILDSIGQYTAIVIMNK